MQKASTGMMIVVLLLVCVAPISQAAPASSVITRYPVSGRPLRVAVEGPGRVWVTLPPQNAIGYLVVSPSGTYDVATYVLPTAGSEPYDIAYAAGAVWVTERLGNKIARFDPATKTWTEYPVPTPDSQPTGLVVLAGSPVQVWFAERSGNKLGQLIVAGDLTGAVAEFPLPAGAEFAQAQMEDVAAVSSDAVWFTLPGAGLIGRFSLPLWGSSQGFYFLNPRNYPWLFPGKTLRPWQMKLDGWGLPWFTEPGTDHIMRYNPNTIAQFEHYPVVSTNGELDGLWVSPRDRPGHCVVHGADCKPGRPVQAGQFRRLSSGAAGAGNGALRHRPRRGRLRLGRSRRLERGNPLVPAVFPARLSAADLAKVVSRCVRCVLFPTRVVLFISSVSF